MSAPLSKIAGAFSETEIDDEVVVMRLSDGTFFSLTSTAAAIWKLIDGTRSRDAVLAALTAEFGQEAEAIAADLDAFVAQLGEAGLIAEP
ncbi:MAG: PqqD family protein [Novosphingobium sp.]